MTLRQSGHFETAMLADYFRVYTLADALDAHADATLVPGSTGRAIIVTVFAGAAG